MPVIKPISDLRNNFKEISQLCHDDGKPIYLTKNGKGDLVVLSVAAYEKQLALLELYQKLAEAEEQSDSKIKRSSHEEVIRRLRSRLNA